MIHNYRSSILFITKDTILIQWRGHKSFIRQDGLANSVVWCSPALPDSADSWLYGLLTMWYMCCQWMNIINIRKKVDIHIRSMDWNAFIHRGWWIYPFSGRESVYIKNLPIWKWALKASQTEYQHKFIKSEWPPHASSNWTLVSNCERQKGRSTSRA